MAEIFLNYRIVDSVYAVAEISKQMAAHLGRTHVFRDHDSLVLGSLYARRIRRALDNCDTMVAVIGPHWLDARDKRGRRRLDDPQDWVRMEIRTAFERGIPVIPVLLDGTPLPTREQLPADIQQLSRVQFWQIRHQTLSSDVHLLLEKLAPGVGSDPTDSGQAQSPGTHHNLVNKAYDGSTIATNQNGTQNVRVNSPRGRR